VPSYYLDATVTSLVAMTVRRATGNDVDTLEWIPGTAVRGALAAWYVRQPDCKAGDARFRGYLWTAAYGMDVCG